VDGFVIVGLSAILPDTGVKKAFRQVGEGFFADAVLIA
jgi:hypothetical protein